MNISQSYQFLFLFAAVIAAVGFGWWHIHGLKKRFNKTFGPASDESAEAQTIRRVARLEAKLEELEPRIDMAQAAAKVAIQKVGFVRFNPFQDTGGDNSFVAVLLDSQNDGFLVSSLYTREGVRLYGKSIRSGRSKHPLSEEEKKVLEETMAQGSN